MMLTTCTAAAEFGQYRRVALVGTYKQVGGGPDDVPVVVCVGTNDGAPDDARWGILEMHADGVSYVHSTYETYAAAQEAATEFLALRIERTALTARLAEVERYIVEWDGAARPAAPDAR